MKKCVFCENVFEPHVRNPKQICCSKDCSIKYQRKRTIESGRKKEQRTRYRDKYREQLNKTDLEYHNQKAFGGLKYEVMQRDNYKCAFCSCDEIHRLIIHHKDEDKQNNVMENLVTLCRACHAREHHAGELNSRYVDISREAIAEAIESTSTLDEAAKKLGITRSTLRKKRQQLGFSPMRNDTKGDW